MTSETREIERETVTETEETIETPLVEDDDGAADEDDGETTPAAPEDGGEA